MTVAELDEFFISCPPDIVPYHILRTVRGMWFAANKPFGAEIQFFKAIKDYRESALYRSDSALRRNLRLAEAKGLIEVAKRDENGNCHHIWHRKKTDNDRGLYRRVTTYRLLTPKLLEWRHRKKNNGLKVEPQRKPSQPDRTPPPTPPAKTEPIKKPTAEHRSTERRSHTLGSRERAKLVQVITELRRGVTGKREVDGYWFDFLPDDPRYRAPLSLKDALGEACKLLLIPLDSAKEALKLAGFQIEE